MAEGTLERLVRNSEAALVDGTYDIDCNVENSGADLADIIRTGSQNTIISEIKFASPSLGKIRERQNPASIARQMIAGGASALSVLTQPHLFCGSPEYFVTVREAVSAPMLMKDIIIDRAQIDAAQRIGADYILLIQSVFDAGLAGDMDSLIEYAHKKDLGVLAEAHTAKEYEGALGTKADIIGINNRNLDTLDIDLDTTRAILGGRQKDRPVLTESGIVGPEDVRYLRGCGADAFLVGSSVMKSSNIESHVRGLVAA